MEIETLRSLITALGLLCFIAIVVWAFSRTAKKGFDEAAMLPFQEDEDAGQLPASVSHTQG